MEIWLLETLANVLYIIIDNRMFGKWIDLATYKDNDMIDCLLNFSFAELVLYDIMCSIYCNVFAVNHQ